MIKVLKTLIVDDNRFNRDTLKELFRRHFPEMVIEEASSGEEATRKVESFAPNLIVMDIRLPDVSGRGRVCFGGFRRSCEDALCGSTGHLHFIKESGSTVAARQEGIIVATVYGTIVRKNKAAI